MAVVDEEADEKWPEPTCPVVDDSGVIDRLELTIVPELVMLFLLLTDRLVEADNDLKLSWSAATVVDGEWNEPFIKLVHFTGWI